jgi:hypothetical protein
VTNRTTLAQLREMGAKKAASLPTDHLAMLLEDVAAQKADAKALDDILTEACDLKFGEKANALRAVEGKDTGRVSIEDGEFVIRADLPKLVQWDQAALEQAMETVRNWGESPKDYVAIKLAVPEAKFKAWPASIRKVFEPARTVGAGKPSFSIERRAA